MAWLFHFPSLEYQFLWRVSAAGVVGVPILVFVLFRLSFENWAQNRFLMKVGRVLS